MERGPWLIDPGLSFIGSNRGISLRYDEEVRCYSYLIKEIDPIFPLPQGVTLRIFPMMGKTGGYYPAIGIYTDQSDYSDEYLFDLAINIEEHLATYLQKIDMSQLARDSSNESLSWQEVLQKWRLEHL